MSSGGLQAACRTACRALAAAALAALIAAPAQAADLVRVAMQRTGTLAWELAVARAHGLDQKAGLQVETLELASPEAGKIALRGGAADIIVSDWPYVSRERSLGARLAFYPYSTALGAVMVPGASPLHALADLKGHTLAVAGGALDKSWLLLQAALRLQHVDLPREARILYGAPALLAQKTARGEMDATLNYWNLCAGLEARGFRRLAAVSDLLPRLGATGATAMLGYVFDDGWAAGNRTALDRFLAMTRDAKDILAQSDAEWQRIAPLVGAADPAALAIYRARYREGIPHRPVEAEEEDARRIYQVLAAAGGTALVGPSPTLAPGTFYRPDAGQN